jgi:phage host-nuclease inhibitor protein Gam
MTQIHSWEEVDNVGKRLDEIEVAVARINGDATLQINEVKKIAADKAASLLVEKEALKKQIEIFCEANKHEFADKRTKELNFITIGYRIVKSLSLPKAKEKIEGLIKTIKALGIKDCIKYEETIDKDAICELDDVTFAKLGIKRTIKDNFRIELHIEKVAETVGATA